MQLSFTFRPPPVVCAGARATEARLVEEVRALLDAGRRDPRLLAQKVRVVVPSRSLRLHVASVLARELGPHLLGISVQTLHGLAREVVGAQDETDVMSSVFGQVLALRYARDEDALRPLLEDYEDAQAALIASVHDLVDAGLRAAHVDAAIEALEEAADLAPGERARAMAIVRAAARMAADADTLGFETPVRLLEAAAAKLGQPGSRLDARAILVHGFADATGVAADLLEQIVNRPGGRIFLDLPPDPAEAGAVDVSTRFGARLRERLRATAAPEAWTQPGALSVFAAEGDDGEALEVARRIAEMLAAGARPEGIGVVARELESRTAALRRHFDRLGVPYSAIGVNGPDTPAARWRGLGKLLRLGPRLPTDHWLELLGSLAVEAPAPPEEAPAIEDPPAWMDEVPFEDVTPPWEDDPDDDVSPEPPEESGPTQLVPALRAAVRLGLRASGAARLGQAARLDADALLRGKDALPLPGGGSFDGPRTSHRTLGGDLLRATLKAAGDLCDWWGGLPTQARPAEWHGHLRHLIEVLLGQPADHPVLAALAPLADLPPLRLDAEELRVVLASLLDDLGRGRFGGAGAGVQVLAVRDARGRTFEHLFFLGNNRRNTNPRDAVLSDPVRMNLRAVLPDLPLRRDRFDEDRLHFAWLLSSAPSMTLSWQTIDGRGKPASVSPLVERLRWAGRWDTAPLARPAYPTDPPPIATASEHATIAALRGGADGLAAHLPLAVGAARRLEGPALAPAAAVASAMVRVVAEKDGPREILAGPYQGWLGPTRGSHDPRARTLYISVVENLVACPWQTLLERLLEAEPVPDPLAQVPQADDRLAGILVHRVLEGILKEVVPAPGGSITEMRSRPAEAVPWPGEEAVRRLSRHEAMRLLEQEGIRLPGLAELLAIRVEPLLEAAREVDWATGGPMAVGAEVTGFFAVDDRTIGFRADRADVHDDVLVLTDYKTGRSFADLANQDARKGRLLERIRTGKNLQAAAYVSARGVDQVAGRYVFLGPGVQNRRLTVYFEDEEVTEALADVVRVAVAALDTGAFFPRLTEPVKDRENDRCRTCGVAEACARGDSTDRGRLRELAVEMRRARPGEITPAERAFRTLWMLPEGG